MENRKIIQAPPTQKQSSSSSLTYHFKSANSSPNSSVDRLQDRSISRGTGIHLSSATRERLWASRTSNSGSTSTACSGQNGVTSGTARPRRLSGSSNHYMYECNGYRNTENTTSTFYYSPGSVSKNTDSAAKMRYANSLESLDAVSTSIQQARAQSSQPMHHNQYHLEPTKTKLSRNEYHQPTSLNYGSCSQNSSNFQRTFPLRKSGKEDVSETYDIRQVLPTTTTTSTMATPPSTNTVNWKSSASTDRLSSQQTSSTASLDPFWTPSRTRRSLNKATHINGSANTNTTGDSAEIHRLERELQEEKDRVQRLSAQLTTNAHVVSAFEHSLSNMTSRLEQLNLTSNRKDRELQELRHIINNLKEKNEMGDQVPSRWKSDDNMLNTQNEAAYDINGHKVSRSGSARSFIRGGRKNSWFRSSLTKAFGKNKSSGNLSNGCHDSPGYPEGPSGPPPPLPSSLIDENINNLVKHRSISTSALDESMIEDLQRQLTVKDDLLTETRLEALSSASQLQSLREQVAKLRNELKNVRQENQDLRTKIKSSTTPAKSPKKSKTDLHLTETSLLLESSNVTDFDEVLDIPVILVVQALPSPLEIRIGSLRIRKNERFCDTKPWTDLDMNVSCLFGLYLARLDPFECLGLNEKSIESYEFLGRIRKFLGHFDFVNEDSNSDSGQYVATQTRIILKLKILDELCFSSLRPILVLQPYLENQNPLWITGPPGSGKSFLAKRMAEYFIKTKRRNLALSEDFVTTLNFKPDEDYIGTFFEKMSLRAKIVIVDEIKAKNEVFESVLVPKIQKSKMMFILVSNEKCHIPDWLQFNMRSDDRLESSFLGFILRRRVLSIETLTLKANDSMIIAVNWLNRMHTLLIEFCDKNSLNMPTMKYFLVKDSPLETITQFRLWFIDLWNLVLIEAFREQLSHHSHQIEDPTKIVARTWPWKDHELEKSLRPLNFNTEDPDSILNKDPLMDMLMCLQEASSNQK